MAVRKTNKKIESVPELVDKLGMTRLKIADLVKEEKPLVARLKALGLGMRYGTLFEANVFNRGGAPVIDYENACKEAKAPKRIMDKHTRTVTVTDWAAVAQEAEVDIRIIAKHTVTPEPVVVCTVGPRKPVIPEE